MSPSTLGFCSCCHAWGEYLGVALPTLGGDDQIFLGVAGQGLHHPLRFGIGRLTEIGTVLGLTSCRYSGWDSASMGGFWAEPEGGLLEYPTEE